MGASVIAYWPGITEELVDAAYCAVHMLAHRALHARADGWLDQIVMMQT